MIADDKRVLLAPDRLNLILTRSPSRQTMTNQKDIAKKQTDSKNSATVSAVTENAKLREQVAQRAANKLAEETEWAKTHGHPDTQRRLKLDPELVVTKELILNRENEENITVWTANLHLYTKLGEINLLAEGKSEKKARAELDLRVEDLLSAIMCPNSTIHSPQ